MSAFLRREVTLWTPNGGWLLKDAVGYAAATIELAYAEDPCATEEVFRPRK